MTESMMNGGLVPSNFSEVFSKILRETGVSCYEISQFSNLDQAYLSRLKNGQKSNPSFETVMKICLALTHLSIKVDLSDVDCLLNSVGRSLHIRG